MNVRMSNRLRIAYFGGQPLGVPVLEILLQHDIVPQLVVTSPDRPAGRGKQLTAPPLKVFAEAHELPVFQPSTLKDPTLLAPLMEEVWDLFVVVAYNQILPQWLIDHPRLQTLNVHPSLLPLLRGPSPIRTAIRDNLPEAVGVSVMVLDAEMDHGDIIAQEAYTPAVWPPRGVDLDTELAQRGGELLAHTIPQWLAGKITPAPQDHASATYTHKITKAQSELTLDPHNLPSGEEARRVFHSIQAYDGFPETFFMHNGARIKIKQAQLSEDKLHLLTVTPEGKKPVDFSVWLATQ